MATGGETIAMQLDVTRLGVVHAMPDRAVEQFGRADVMLNDAGVAQFGKR